MSSVNITCIFDITCPWCYISHTYLHRAIKTWKQTHPKDNFNLTLKPFYIKPPPRLSEPPFPVPTQSRRKLREETYGISYAQTVLKNIEKAGNEAGLHLKFNGLTGPTRNGHRLVQYAQRSFNAETAERVLEDLFVRYHEREEDITQLELLTNVGVANELGAEAEVKTYLESGQDAELMDRMVNEAASERTGGVPWFVVSNEKHGEAVRVDGSQTDVAWLSVFKKVR